jgi:hypothetical protein
MFVLRVREIALEGAPTTIDLMIPDRGSASARPRSTEENHADVFQGCCHANAAGVPPALEPALARERSHTSRLTIVQMITLPPLGGFRGGRSTIAEYGLRSCGVMEPSWVYRRGARQRRCLNLKPIEGHTARLALSPSRSNAQTPQIFL